MLGQCDFNEKVGAEIRFNNARRIMKYNYNSTFVGVSWVMAGIVD